MLEHHTVFVLGQNLFFLPRIMNAAKHSGLSMRLTNTEADFWKAYQEQPPALVLVDLEGDPDVWPKVLEQLRTQDSETSLVAFGPHTDVKGMELARNLGCDQVLSKGEFSRDMIKLIAQYADSAVE